MHGIIAFCCLALPVTLYLQSIRTRIVSYRRGLSLLLLHCFLRGALEAVLREAKLL